MNDQTLENLLARARESGPRDTSRQQYGFETRLLARLSPSPFGVWLWRLAPFFAVVALTMAWNVWHTSPEHEYTIRTELEESATEWTYIAGLTGRVL